MSSIEVRVGANVWFEGALWRVDEVTGAGVRIRNGGNLREVGIGGFSESVLVGDDDLPADAPDPLGLVLTSLDDKELERLKTMEPMLKRVIEARESGAAAGPLYEEAAQELGFSVPTLKRKLSGYRAAGLAGLVDSSVTRKYDSRVDSRWDAACVQVLDTAVYASTPTRDAVIRRVNSEVARVHGEGVVQLPGRTTAFRRLNELAKGRHSFGSGRGRRSVSERPDGVYGRLDPTYPGEYVLLDTTPLDVFAMEPVTGRWVPTELTVAIDLFSRCILGMRLSPVSTKSGDVANVLYQAVKPPADDDETAAGFPYHGVPKNVLVPGAHAALDRGCVPSTVVVDHGKQYLSDHVIGACARLGINVQPAIPLKPTDKPAVERFFRTLRESLLQHLPAYKGPDVYSRGKDIEDQAYLLVTEMEQLIREWVGSVYHSTKHSSLQLPELPGMFFSPAELFDIGRTRTGVLRLPARPELAYEFLQVHWRTIQHYGVEVKGQVYNGPALNAYRNRKSGYRGRHAGKWPFFYDAHDIRQVYFRDPETGEWSALEWRFAQSLNAPFSQDAADYAKTVAIRDNRHVDPHEAVGQLLATWSKGEVSDRRERSLARRISAQRATAPEPEDSSYGGNDAGIARIVASYPGVIDMLGRQGVKDPGENAGNVPDQDDGEGLDVFEKYYRDHPEGGLEFME